VKKIAGAGMRACADDATAYAQFEALGVEAKDLLAAGEKIVTQAQQNPSEALSLGILRRMPGGDAPCRERRGQGSDRGASGRKRRASAWRCRASGRKRRGGGRGVPGRWPKTPGK
jgi:hypothetical protein